MLMTEIIQSNYTTVIGLLCFILFLITNQTLDKKMSRIFGIETAIATLLVVTVAIDYWCAQQSEPMLLRYITSATGYTFRPVIIMIMVNMLAGQRNKYEKLLWALVIVNGVLSYSSYFTSIVFYFDEVNEFQRGPVGSIPFVVSGIFLYLLIVTTVKRFRMGRFWESLVIFLVAVINILGVVFEAVFKYHFVLNGGIVVSIVFYYLYLHVQTYKRDALTGILNRHAFYIDSEKLSEHPMLIVSLDMNDLKKINDNQGHAKGDEAIKTVADGIQNNLKTGSYFYRVGGDEFVILLPKTTIEEGKRILQNIYEEIQKTPYRVAYGMAEYLPDMEFEKVYAASDGKMYDMKQQMKKEN